MTLILCLSSLCPQSPPLTRIVVEEGLDLRQRPVRFPALVGVLNHLVDYTCREKGEGGSADSRRVTRLTTCSTCVYRDDPEICLTTSWPGEQGG